MSNVEEQEQPMTLAERKELRHGPAKNLGELRERLEKVRPVPVASALSFDTSQPNTFEEQRDRVLEMYTKALDTVFETTNSNYVELHELCNRMQELLQDQTQAMKDHLAAHLRSAQVAHLQAVSMKEAIAKAESEMVEPS